jgi:hypothetical protein
MSRSVNTIRDTHNQRILGYTIWNNTVDAGYPVVYDTKEQAWDAARANAYLRPVDVDTICLGCTIWAIVVEGDAEDVRGMYCPTHHLITSDMNPLHSEAV